MAEAVLTPTIHDSELGYWEMRPYAPSRAVQPLVQRLTGYVQRPADGATERHRQMPSTRLPLIIQVGEPLRGTPAHGEELRPYQAFVAGLHDSYATTEFHGEMAGVQLDLSPLGMQALLGGRPMHELTNEMLDLEDVLGAEGRDLVAQLQEQSGWESRFERVEAFVEARLEDAPAPAEDVAYAWHRLERTAGCISIGALAGEMGYSRKQLIARFRQHIGMPPKLVARVFRFQHAREMIEADPSVVNWADVAFDAGYYDQSHLIRDFVEFSGSTPTDYVARLLPGNGGMRGD